VIAFLLKRDLAVEHPEKAIFTRVPSPSINSEELYARPLYNSGWVYEKGCYNNSKNS
jgi:hypothetical protein